MEALAAGRDGLIVRNIVDSANVDAFSSPQTTFLAFSPEQIKSATANSGAFDPDNPDIRKALRRYSLPLDALEKALGRVPAVRLHRPGEGGKKQGPAPGGVVASCMGVRLKYGALYGACAPRF